MTIKDYFSTMPTELSDVGEVPELKLLKAFAFNAYYGADPISIDDCLEATAYDRRNQFGIDGVYVNRTLEENAIECVYSYFVSGNSFNKVDVFKALESICSQIDSVRQHIYTTNKKTDNLLKDKIDEFIEDDSKVNIVIRIITNYVCDEKEKYELSKKVEEYDVSVKTFKVTATISFGDDIESVIDSNIAPYDYVAGGMLIVDKTDNILKYGDDSFICNISAQSLKSLWHSDGNKGLLAMNLRYYIKSGAIDSKIEDSILFNGNNFWYLNNGIIIVCDDYSFVKNELRLKNFSIVNGGQTTRMIGTIPFDNDFYISCKVVKNTFETPESKNEFISKVAEASNTQKPIKPKDIIANKIEQRNLKSLLSANNIFIEIKRGEHCINSAFPEPWQRTKNNELAQDLYSFVFMEPGPARNSVSTILQNEDKYNIIFKNHTYPVEFLKDLLFLEKAYREYQRMINKKDDVDPIKKGLVKNGMYYCLATIGYILKLVYNTEYNANMVKYRNNEAMFNLFSPELAFINHFVPNNQTYTEFKKNAFDMFDFVFTNLMITAFRTARANNESLAYSNWTKSNTGFNAIRTMINSLVFDSKQDYILKGVTKHFAPISEDDMAKNIDLYVDYCKSNKKITAKTSSGHELNDDDKQLRDELMVYRMNYSLNKHIAEKNVFTEKMLDALVVEKPVTIDSLKKIVSPQTAYFCGKEILDIIAKHF